MAFKNRLKEIRHQMMIDTKKEFAELIEVTPSQLSIWESQKQQPSLDTLIKIWLNLLPHLKQLNLQDLLDYGDLE